MRVAYHSPLPPEASGIADYSALLLPALRGRIPVSVAHRRRPLFRRTHVALYHIGNDPGAHGWIVKALRRRPGVVVLHDFVLHHLVAGMTLGRGDAAGYLAAMEREAGPSGRLLAQQVVAGEAAPPWETRPEEFPLAGEVLELASGLIVHSGYVERLARGAGYSAPVWRIPHPVWPAPEVEPAEVSGSPVYGAFGHVNPSKRIPQLLQAFRRVLDRRPETRLLLAGAVSPRFELEARIEALGLEHAVMRTGYVDGRRLWALMAACDVVVSLRAPTMGETSGVALRALALGKALVVSDVGWFSELPDEVATKVPVDEREVDALAAALEELGSNESARGSMGEAGRDYVRREHDLERVAGKYASALEWAAGGEAVTDAVLEEIAQAAADVAVGADSPELLEIASAVRDSDIVVLASPARRWQGTQATGAPHSTQYGQAPRAQHPAASGARPPRRPASPG